MDKEKDLLTRRMGSSSRPFSTWWPPSTGTKYSADARQGEGPAHQENGGQAPDLPPYGGHLQQVHNIVEMLDKEKDLLTRRMGAKLQTLIHMAATFNR
jgi:hypothetical protein